jgi:hypothetical protein
MKKLIFISILITIVSTKAHNQKSLIIGKWRQFAWKPHNSNKLKVVSEDCASKKITFEESGFTKKKCIA